MDPLAPLLSLADVAPAFAAARAAVDDALRHPALRRSGGLVAAEVGLRSSVASAALAGAVFDRETVRDGVVTDPVVQGALRASAALDGLAPTWSRAPRQVLARLQTLITVGPGRPSVVSPRFDALMDLVAGGTSAPALLLAAVVHGELLSLRAFPGPNGVLARAAARLTLISGGLDPRGVLPVDVGHLAREPEYVGSSGAFSSGTPDGVRSWLRHYASAVTVAATELVDACEMAADRG